MADKKMGLSKMADGAHRLKLIRTVIVRAAFYFLLATLSFVFLYPFIKMITQSLMTEDDLINITVKWLPSKLMWSNYQRAYEMMWYQDFVWNSVIVSLGATVGHVFSCALTGYAFARYKFRGKTLLFGLVILSMIVPIQTIIFPLYIQYTNWGWVDSHLPLLVPTFFGFGLNGAFFIFLFRQFFAGLPYEMEEAARIDGCGPIRTYVRIMLPMSQSSLLVCAVLSIVWHWNDYFEPGIYINDSRLKMLPNVLPSLYALLQSENYDIFERHDIEKYLFNEAMVMAGTFMVILPILVIYLILQRRFMEGVERSGLTGT